MQGQHQPGAYSICPLCDELILHPKLDPDSYHGGTTLDEIIQQQVLAYQAELEATLMDHLRTHTAQVILQMDQ